MGARGLELGSSDDLATQIRGFGVRSKLLCRNGQASAALSLAEQADRLAKSSDSPVERGTAALNLAEVLYLTGDRVQALEMAQRAIDSYQRKGATAYVARAHHLATMWTT